MLLRHLPRRAICAEIGVWKGEFSARILRRTRPKQLHLIDPWKFEAEYPERYYGGGGAANQDDMNRVFDDLRSRLAKKRNVVIHRGMSRDVLPTFGDAHFDWIYIDGNHTYEFVLEDLQLCLRKTKPNGIIAGDDYNWRSGEGYPVRRAVSPKQ
ncbi:MAG: class I SAM-dependent methyltransferase [Gammaproteobacteria bacterium]|nr:class I SAM-dependent methyltransferase [Gammaproteobacteria bacterium]